MLGSIRGRPTVLKLPIQKATVHWLLAWRLATLAAHRARLLTVVAETLTCMRVNEVAGLRAVVRPPDVLLRAGLGAYRSAEEGRKGHCPAFGRSTTWSLIL